MGLRLITAIVGAAALFTAVGAAPITLTLGDGHTGSLTVSDTEEIIDTCERADPAFLRDVFRVEVPPRSEIEVMVASEFDAYLYLYDQDGELLGENDDHSGTRTSRILQNVGESEVCHAVVTSFAQGVTGGYEITINHPGPEPPSSGPRPMVIGETVGGYLVPGDAVPLRGTERAGIRFHRDAMRIDLAEGEVFHVEVEANFDSYVFLTDTDGKIIAENDDGDHHLHSRLLHHAATSESLHLVITSFAPLREGAWSYTVTSGWGEGVVEEAPSTLLPGWPIANSD